MRERDRKGFDRSKIILVKDYSNNEKLWVLVEVFSQNVPPKSPFPKGQ